MPSTHLHHRNGAARKASAKAPSDPLSKANEVDAIALLKRDHREVETLFEQFEKTRSEAKRGKLAGQICRALKIHTKIEEELFYPACRKVGVKSSDIDESLVEHQAAKDLIAKIEKTKPGEELFDAQVHVLSEEIKHHVKEEEERGGVFAEARQAGIDMKTLGAQLQARKGALTKAH
jgi:hemerythrin superfamily protein